MTSRRVERAKSDARPSAKLVQAALKNKDDEAYGDIVAILHARGGDTEFRLAKELCAGSETPKRLLGIEILGQLGWSDRTFLEESVDLLVEMLQTEDDPALLRCLAIALGHRSHLNAIPALLKHKTHPDASVRYGVVFGLLGLEDPQAIDALVELSDDPDQEVRNWATFGLGSQVDTDTPALQKALLARAQDKHQETRGEAMVGLARRKHNQARTLIRKELSRRDLSPLALEAAAELADTTLYADLLKLKQSLQRHKDTYLLERLEAALQACQPPPPEPALEPRSSDE